MTEDELYEVNGGISGMFNRKRDADGYTREKSKYGDGHETKKSNTPSKKHYHPYRYAVARAAAEIVFVGHDAPAMKDTFAVIGATILDNFGLKMPENTIGYSILDSLK